MFTAQEKVRLEQLLRKPNRNILEENEVTELKGKKELYTRRQLELASRRGSSTFGNTANFESLDVTPPNQSDLLEESNKETEVSSSITAPDTQTVMMSTQEQRLQKQKDLLKEIDSRIKELNDKPKIQYDRKLSRESYRDWAFDMESDLEYYSLDGFINGSFGTEVHEEPLFIRYDKLTRNLICRNMEDTLRNLVASESTAQGVWQRVRTHMEGSPELKTVRAISEFYSEVATFTSMENLVRSMKHVIKTLTESVRSGDSEAVWRSMFLAALPQSFDHLRVTLMAMQTPRLEAFYETALQSSRMRSDQTAAHRIISNNITFQSNQNSGCFDCGGPHLRKHCPLRANRGNQAQNGQRNGQNSGRRNGQRQPGGGQRNSGGQNPNNNNQQSNGQRQSGGGNQRGFGTQPNLNDNNDRNGRRGYYNNASRNQNNSLNNNSNSNGRNATIGNLNSNLNSNLNGNPVNNTNGEISVSSQPMASQLGSNFQFSPLFDNTFLNADPSQAYSGPAPGVPIFGNCLRTRDKKAIENVQQTAKACKENLSHLKIKPTDIFMDSGSSDVMTNQEQYIISLRSTEKDQLNVETADGGLQGVQGFGTMAIKSRFNVTFRMSNTILCKGLQATFLSASKLDKEADLLVVTGHRQVRVIGSNQVLMDGPLLENGLYKLTCTVETPIAYLATVRLGTMEDRFRFYHEIFCHLNGADLTRMKEKLNVVMPENFECYICAKSKIKTLPFKSSEIRTTKPLELVHMDLSGQIRVPNREQLQYFLLIIDDFSRFIHVALIKYKSEAFDAFLKFKAVAERATNQQLVVFRSDNGKEFVNWKFSALSDEQGLQRQFTTIHTPQQNAVAERGMGVIKQMARSMLLNGNTATSHWPYAVRYAVFTKNLVPNSAIKHEIPYERYYGKPFKEYGMLRPFGMRCVYKDETANDFESPGKDGAFFGIPLEVKAYYVYSFEQRKVLIRRNVTFLHQSPYNEIRVPSENGERDVSLEDEELCEESREQIPHKLRLINLMLPDKVTILSENSSNKSNNPNESPGQNAEFKQPDKPNNNPDPPTRFQGESHLRSSTNGGISGCTDSVQATIASPEVNLAELDMDFVDEELSDQGDLNLSSERIEQQVQRTESDCSPGDFGQNERGEIIFNEVQRKRFEQNHPEINLKPLRGAPWKKGKGKWTVYRINSVTAPKNVSQAINSPNAAEWKEAMICERDRLIATGTLAELVPRPPHTAVLPLMWIFAIKLALNGMIDRFKARLVVLGNRQRIGRDFAETFAPVINELTFRIFLSYVVQFGWILHHVDVKTAYLNAEIQGEVYVQQPPGFIVPGKEKHVYRLGKALYGLRQSAYQWFRKLNDVMTVIGFKRSLSDQCLFVGCIDGEPCMVAIYVDDCLIAAKSLKAVQTVKSKLKEHFDLTDKQAVRHFLNLDIDYEPNDHVLFISQSHYIKQLLQFTGMTECKGAKTPVVPGTDLFKADGKPFVDVSWYQQVMGRLIYLATHSRPDIAFVVARLCAFMHAPTEEHIAVVKRTLRYLQGTINYRLSFRKNQLNSTIYCDADYANDQYTSHSVTGVATFVFGNLVDWFSRKQRRVANSTCQAEVNAIVEAALEAEFVYKLLVELRIRIAAITVYNDNQSAQMTIQQLGDFGKNKHYRTIVNLVREVVQLGWIQLKYCPTEQMIADFLTKPMVEAKLSELVGAAGVHPR